MDGSNLETQISTRTSHGAFEDAVPLRIFHDSTTKAFTTLRSQLLQILL